MEIQSIRYGDLSDDQVSGLDELANDSLPQGQCFFVIDGRIVAFGTELRDLFVAQNRDKIESGEAQEIVFSNELPSES